MMVICAKCGADLDEELFYKVMKRGKIVRHSWCKECVCEYEKQRRNSNQEQISSTKHNYYLAHKNEILAQMRQYYETNKDRIKKRVNAYTENRMKTDHGFCVKRRLRQRLRTAFKVYSTSGKVRKSRDYGVDYEQIFLYLGPCPGNLKDYHIDHIRPLCLFDFDDLEQIRLAFAPENHQWLRKEENLAKHCKTVIVIDDETTQGEDK